MLKYLALLKVDQPQLWTSWHSGPTAHYFKSPIETDKAKVEKWLRTEEEKYPDARININQMDKKYLIWDTIIAFDEAESKNVEEFFKRFPF